MSRAGWVNKCSAHGLRGRRFDREAFIGSLADEVEAVRLVGLILADAACEVGHHQMPQAELAFTARATYQVEDGDSYAALRRLRELGAVAVVTSGDRESRTAAITRLRPAKPVAQPVANEAALVETMVWRFNSDTGQWDRPMSANKWILEHGGRRG